MSDERITEKMVEAAAKVRLRNYQSEYDAPHMSWREFTGEAREILEAALDPKVAVEWAHQGPCQATTDGAAFFGAPGSLVCARPLHHRNQHRSAEGATW